MRWLQEEESIAGNVGHSRLGGESRANQGGRNRMTLPRLRTPFNSTSLPLHSEVLISLPNLPSPFRFRLCLTMASIARQSPLLRQTCLSAFRSPLATKNVSQAVAFHASAKKQILPPLPRE